MLRRLWRWLYQSYPKLGSLYQDVLDTWDSGSRPRVIAIPGVAMAGQKRPLLVLEEVMSMQTDFEEPRDRKLPKHTAFFPGPPPTEPPVVPVEPLTDKQFEFIVNALANERALKAARLNEALRETHGDQAVLFDPATMPVLVWADPRTFERVVDYAARLVERMNTPVSTPPRVG